MNFVKAEFFNKERKMKKKPPKLRKYPDDDEGDLLMQKADVSLLDAEVYAKSFNMSVANLGTPKTIKISFFEDTNKRGDAEIVTIVPAGTKHVTNFIPDSEYSSKEFGDSGLAVAWIK